MSGRGNADTLDKRKVCVFLLLVAIALLCVGVLTYTLFYASPHAGTSIQNGKHSLLRTVNPPGWSVSDVHS